MVVVSGGAAALLYITRVLETALAVLIILTPILNLAFSTFTIPGLILTLFLILCGVLVLFGCWKFECVRKCTGQYFGFLFHEAFRGIYELILGMLVYNGWKTWYQVFMSVACILGVVTGVLLMVLKCLLPA